MDEQEFRELIAIGHEQSGVEFKGPGSRTDKPLLAKVIRAALGMANRRDGGRIIIGVNEDDNGAPIPTGISDQHLDTWSYDELAYLLDEFSYPNVLFDLKTKKFDGKNFVVIEIREFDDIPVLCNRNYGEVLRKGACYVRPRRKPETSEIPAQADMRDLLDLAVEKRLRKFIATASKAGLLPTPAGLPSDSDRFNQQVKSLLGQV